MTIPLPSHAYVPGQTQRHPDAAFAEICATATPGLSEGALAQTTAFQAGLLFRANGYFWEAHEVLEPVWMACPKGSEPRAFVQAMIQTANAQLKLLMKKPKAAARICDLALDHLTGLARGRILNCEVDDLRMEIHRIQEKCDL